MVVIIRRRLLIIVGCVLGMFSVAALATALVMAYAVPQPQITVVIDAGHGGVDAGVIGINSGVKESDINFLISQSLKKMLENNNINVVMTRNNQDGLYGNLEGRFKARDMQKRKDIILLAQPDIVVSIHCNKFPASYRRGAQVFFDSASEKSQSLAKLLQSNLNVLNKKHVDREFSALKGDYYMLKCSPYPSVIVECGFLSNPEDDVLLNNADYRQQLCESITNGILGYLINIH